MHGVLQKLANIYNKSSAGRKGASKDFTIDYELFLRRIHCADGEEREIAERELAAAASLSKGILTIDRQPRTGMPTLLRLSRSGGEEWLFAQIGTSSPLECRTQLADFFSALCAAHVPDKWHASWIGWLNQLSEKALAGENLHPFKREDLDANRSFADALIGILNWQGSSLIRYASSAICGDSKELQRLEPRLRVALQYITGNDSFEALGILHKHVVLRFMGH